MDTQLTSFADMRSRISFERKCGKPELDERGQAKNKWQTFTKRKAKIETLTGNSFFANRKHWSNASHQLNFRYVEGLKEQDRIVYRGRIFHILVIRNLGELDREHEVICSENT